MTKKSRIYMPCPFCGGVDISVKFGGHKGKGGTYVETAQAFCEECRAHGPKQEIRNLNGRPSMGGATRNYLMCRALFFFGHGYLDIEDTQDWNLAKHGDIIRDDAVPDFKGEADD